LEHVSVESVFGGVLSPAEKANESVLGIGQATKSARRMPRHRQPKKDVDSCEKLRGVANRL
jgi:hypothetical protein